MPIYTYACSECKQEWTEIRRIAERNAVDIHGDGCDGNMVRKIDVPGAVWAPTSTGSNLK